jgi:hypothetical protein
MTDGEGALKPRQYWDENGSPPTVQSFDQFYHKVMNE